MFKRKRGFSFILILIVNTNISLLSLIHFSSAQVKPLTLTPKIRQKARQLVDQSPPQARFDLARWNWKIKQKQSRSSLPSSKISTAEEQISAYQSLLNFFKTLNSKDPRFQIDLNTHQLPHSLQYTQSFQPSIAPYKRLQVWNRVRKDGGLAIKRGQLEVLEAWVIDRLKRCISGPITSQWTNQTQVVVGHQKWINQKQINLDCLQEECYSHGAACFLSFVELNQWSLHHKPYLIASVSPVQSIMSLTSEFPIVFRQDEASQYEIDPFLSLKTFQKQLPKVASTFALGFLVYSPLSYFQNHWTVPPHLDEITPHPDLTLPLKLRKEAYRVHKTIGITPRQNFQEQIYGLVHWFRNFQTGVYVLLDIVLYTVFCALLQVCQSSLYSTYL